MKKRLSEKQKEERREKGKILELIAHLVLLATIVGSFLYLGITYIVAMWNDYYEALWRGTLFCSFMIGIVFIVVMVLWLDVVIKDYKSKKKKENKEKEDEE